MRTNFRAFKGNRGLDYIPIAVFFSHEQASQAARELRPVLARRGELFGHPADAAQN